VGLPLSFVIVMIDSSSCIGFVIGSGCNGYLVPLHIRGLAVKPTTGFPYFYIDVDYDEASQVPLYSPGKEGNVVMHHSIVNYGHLLPHLASVGQDDSTVEVLYSIVTIDAYHMNCSYQFT
jgi:hypothetical protein